MTLTKRRHHCVFSLLTMVRKEQLLSHYKQLLQDRIDVFRDMIENLADDARNDAKSSAGDKHETALSMMQLEQEKLNAKLSEIYSQKAILDKIDGSQQHVRVALGSIVATKGMLLFVSAALPKIVLDGKTIIALSPQSPLGVKLLGQSQGFSFEMLQSSYTIDAVY